MALKNYFRTLSKALLVAIAFYFGAKLGLALSTPPDYIATFWPPNTVVLAALIFSVPRKWWIYFLAMTPAYFTAAFQAGFSLPRALVFYGANCTEILIAAGALRFFLKSRVNFGQMRGMLCFLFWAVLFAPMVSAFIASLATFREPEVNYWLAWRVWFLGDALGHLTLTPVILLWIFRGRDWLKAISLSRFIEALVLSVALFFTGFFALGGPIGAPGNIPILVYLPLPLMLWASIRFGPHGICMAVFTITLLSIWNAINSRGPFIMQTPAENVLSLQMFLVGISLPLMFLGTLLAERKELESILIENEKKYRDLFEHANDAIFLIDPQSRKILDCNKQGF